MVRRAGKVASGLAVVAASALALTGCGAGSTPVESDGAATITVSGLPPTTNQAGRDLFLRLVDEFEEANPGITIEPTETAYDPQTFSAQVAGGTLPTAMAVPATEIQSLIARQQVKDVSAYYEENASLQALNPSVVANVQNSDGAYFGIPTSAFTLALITNRAVFESAGLDPDTTPLETWDDVAAAAKTISEKSDAAGMAQLTSNNQGGWVLTAMSAAFGGRVQEQDGDQVESTVDNPGTHAALEYLADLRWKDDALGSNFLMQFEDAAAALAAGQYGMLIGASEWYNQLTAKFGMAPEDFGLHPLPQEKDGLGALGGGSVMIISPKATDAEAAAAVKWTDFFYLRKFVDTTFAAEDAASTAEDGGAVPRVGLPVVDQETYAAYLDAVADSVNVPLENLDAYLTATESPDFTVVTEPAVEAQQVYSVLDSVVQAVLTDENADIDALLAQAQSSTESIVSAAAQ